MNCFLLDTSAFLTLRDNEEGAEQVANILRDVRTGDKHCVACFITHMEILYRIWKDEGEAAGRLAYEQSASLPVAWVHESRALLEKSAEIKATHSLSLTDSWIAATAIQQKAVLVHKDPEFELLDWQQLVLPYN